MRDVVDDVSHQLHAGIMKSARRVLIDEIFSCVLPDLIASKKTEKQLAAKLKNQVTKVCFIWLVFSYKGIELFLFHL
jgi:hypothetical protein